ncbi:hemolysin family protein [Melioribacter sp. OK-6-Me]|uniref:hemolysin family protein n=1 Tax=unclassified Melioribacter TaxID=2627329 RepID=UPI003EDB44DB
MVNDLLILILLLIASAFFSSAEIAYIVANKIKLEIRARKGNYYAKTAFYFVQKPAAFFSTILISDNIVNISFASISSYFLLNYFGYNEFQILIISTLFLLLFGELIPKYIGREVADALTLMSSVPIRILSILFSPFIAATSRISSIVERIDAREEEDAVNEIDRDDIQNLIVESSQAQKIDEEQSDIINKIIEIRDQKVYEAMTPRTDIVGVDINSSTDEVLETFIESGYSKLIVYEENLDNIKGMVLVKDFLKMPEELKSVLRDVTFVPESKKSLEMLNEFLSKQFSLAVVVDEFGGTAGIITVEDLIEELFGEIRDEYDVDEIIARKIGEQTYILSGKVEIDYLNEEFNLNIEEGDYETLAGYITTKLGRIPRKDESFNIDNFSIQILKSDKKKIDLVKLYVKDSN